MKKEQLTQLYGRTRLMLNLERSGMMTMTKEIRQEAEMLCFYLVRRHKSNGAIARAETFERYGISEETIFTMIKRWKC